MAYDRDVVVNCFKRHYKLLVKAAYFDPAEILYPPDEGWSDEKLAADVLRTFGRSEEVIDLLRHLPYIKQLDGDVKDELYFESRHLSYLRDTWPFRYLTVENCQGKQLFDKLLMPSPEDWPAGFIALTQDIYGTWWIFDTAKGIIHLMGTGYTEPPENEPWLLGAVSRDIQEYFDEIYNEIVALIMVPCPKGENSWNRTIQPYTWDVGSVVSQTLRKHGWPDNLDRDAYLQELKEVHPET
ncbi:hypothetical protein OPT61_g8038 [Boeremia exigua]|uniref:Uncharacterized protein n=1 Tax=Boeremia exigua TaxID=749465 RepID=A0ACC2I100_9PLEO|nr:hypothetical protein OPT61_g8038 [Boeremia exigua]